MNTTDNTRFWLRKLVSPTGLMLVFILLFMPFVGAACGPIKVDISGWDMAVGGEPSVSTGGLGSIGPSDPASETNTVDDIPAQPLMVITIFLVTAAIVLGLTLRTIYARALCGLIVTGLAALFVGLNEAVIMDKLVDEIVSSDDFTQGDAAEIVGTRVGFWLTLTLLLTILVYNGTELLLDYRRKIRPAWPGQYGPPPGYGYPPQQSGWPPQGNQYPQQPPGQFQQ
jgi:hypothetical protein